MTPEQQREVWEMLDRDYLAEVARKGPAPIFATVSGAHLYGFASPDSDVDLRGAFMLPASAMLGLHPPEETITIEDKTTIDLDWVAHDIRKFARLMTKNHNGYVLEQRACLAPEKAASPRSWGCHGRVERTGPAPDRGDGARCL